jgi:hypothetical protein
MMIRIRRILARMDPRYRLALFAGATVALVAVLVCFCGLVLRDSSTHRVASPAVTRRPLSHPRAASASVPPTTGPGSTLDDDLARLNGAPDVIASASSAFPAIGDEARQQPDLYASAFTTELLTQNYRTDRTALLAWVQLEATPCNEPLVVGLVPPALRPKLAVWTVSNTADGSQPPVPSATDWDGWAAHAGSTTAKVTRVTEPESWADAVRTGRITDPHVIARDVDAIVTTRWTERGHVRTAKRTVTLGLTLELRPDGRGYGFVDVATYTTAQIGG